ncbi:MAG TPA: hypothetical protein VF377_08935 [Acidimicrobiia bacterium]
MPIDLVDPTLPQEERQGLLEPLSQGDLAGFARNLSRFMLPTTGMEGERSLSDLFAGFLEFTKVGDVGDFLAGIDPEVDLDPLERALAVAGIGSVAGVGALGTRHAYRELARRAAETRPAVPAQRIMIGPDGTYAMDPWEGGVETVPPAQLPQAEETLLEHQERVRQHQAHLEKLAFESRSPLVRAAFNATDFTGLAAVGRHLGFDQDALEAAGRAIIAHSKDPQLYGDPETAPFVAAQVALAKFERVTKLDIVEVRTPEGKLDKDLLLDAGSIVDRTDWLVRLHLATEALSADLNLDNAARIGKIVLHTDSGFGPDVEVYGGIIDALLPTERLWDPRTLFYAGDIKKVSEKIRNMERRFKALDWEPLEGILASNHLRSIVAASYLGDGRWDLDKRDWYFKMNRSATTLAEATGLDVTQAAGILSALSAQAPWHHNLVSGIHLILQMARPDLNPASAEYQQIFRDATIGAGWAPDIYEYSGAAVKRLSQQGGLEATVMHYADPENIRGEGGFLAGTNTEKLEKAELILHSGLPAWVVLRMLKTGTFHWLGAHPDLDAFRNLTTNDTHTARLGQGGVTTPVLMFHGVEALPLEPDRAYTDPVSGATITGREVIAGLERMREHGWTDEQIEAYKGTLAKYPTATLQARYMSQTRALLIARDLAGFEYGHQAQAAGWGLGQEMSDEGRTLKRLRAAIENGKSLTEVRQLGRMATFDDTIIRTAEGNQPYAKVAYSFLQNASADLSGPNPTADQLNEARTGLARASSGDHMASIVFVLDHAGQPRVWVDTKRRNTPGVADTLRTLAPTGIRVGQWERYVPREALEVRSILDHLKTFVDYADDKGLTPSAELATFVPREGFTHPALTPGTKLVVFADREAGSRLKQALDQLPYTKTELRAAVSRTAASNEHLDAEDMIGLSEARFTELMRSVDWYTIASPNMDQLLADVRRLGGNAFLVEGYWTEQDGTVDHEPAAFITGITPEQAAKLGTKHNQQAIAGRMGFIWTDDPNNYRYHPATGEYFIDDKALPEAWTKFHHTSRRFTAGYDFDTVLPFNVNSPKANKAARNHGLLEDVPRRAFMVDFGAEGTLLNHWSEIQRAVDLVNSIPGVDVRLYANATNHIPDGFEQVYETIYTDLGGRLGTALHGQADPYARHQVPVYVPRRKAAALSKAGFATEGFMRDPVDARKIIDIDEELGQVWFDGDVVVRYQPEQRVRIKARGPVWGGMTVNGRKVTRVAVDARGPIPVIDVNPPNIPMVGVALVDLKDGYANKILIEPDDNWLPVRDTLGRAGLLRDTKPVKVESPTAPDWGEVELMLDQGAYKVSPQEIVGWEDTHISHAIETQGPEDAAFERKLQVELALPVGVVNLGTLISPDVRTRIHNTILDLVNGEGLFRAGVEAVGRVPRRAWTDRSILAVDPRGVDPEWQSTMAFYVHRQMSSQIGLYINEAAIVQAFNVGARLGGVELRRRTLAKPAHVPMLEYSITHEIGHMVADEMNRDEFLRLVDQTAEQMGYQNGARLISYYAGWNPDEFFGEVFAKAMLDPAGLPKPALDLVKTVLESVR